MKISLYYPTLFILFFSAQILHSQILDDFSDGNFDQNPSWVGDAANFKISTAGELQLNATMAGNSSLWVTGNIPDSTVWDFDLRLSFDPSNQNQLRVYLQSDQADPTLANGYFIEMGETGSADAIKFYRQDAGIKTQLAVGQAGLAASFPNLHIRTKRTKSGDWTLEAGPVGSALQAQFSLMETTWPGGTNRFFGIQCVYTISNATKFFLDNINIRPDVPDTQPPVLVAATADNQTQITVVFDEDLDLASAENPANYSINNGIGQPLSASLLADNRSVVLALQNSLATGNYTLQTSAVQDGAGNESGLQTIDFQYVVIALATEFDILISEIMADPSPTAGLPEVEWLEIFNRSNKTIDLATIRIQDATGAPVPLPSYLIQAGEYVALCAAINASTLQAATTGKTLGLAVSPSILNNDSDVLTLSDAVGNVIDRVAYDVLWHTIPGREDGGYSLERANLGLPCLGGENWQSCPVTIGGTPAAQNAAFSMDPDDTAPRLFKAFPESPSSILLTFTKGLAQAAAEDAAAYQLVPNIAVAAAEQLSTDRALVRLTLASPLQPATVYILSVENSVEDCSGNPFEFTDTTYIGLAEKPDIQDIVINEIMFNPSTGNARYLEFYNRSQKIFDWSEFFLASNSDTSTSKVQILQDRLFFPGNTMFLATMRQMYERALPISSKKMCCKMPSLRWMTTMTASKFIGPVEVKASPLTPFITGAGCTMACFPLPNKRGWPWSGFGWMGPPKRRLTGLPPPHLSPGRMEPLPCPIRNPCPRPAQGTNSFPSQTHGFLQMATIMKISLKSFTSSPKLVMRPV